MAHLPSSRGICSCILLKRPFLIHSCPNFVMIRRYTALKAVAMRQFKARKAKHRVRELQKLFSVPTVPASSRLQRSAACAKFVPRRLRRTQLATTASNSPADGCIAFPSTFPSTTPLTTFPSSLYRRGRLSEARPSHHAMPKSNLASFIYQSVW